MHVYTSGEGYNICVILLRGNQKPYRFCELMVENGATEIDQGLRKYITCTLSQSVGRAR